MAATTFTEQLTLGERLERSRKLAGMSRRVLADALGIHDRSVVNYERGDRRPAFDLVCAWSAATGVPLRYFADGTLTESDPPATTCQTPDDQRQTADVAWFAHATRTVDPHLPTAA